MANPIYKKKLFKHGGSKAIDLPKEANLGNNEVIVEVRNNGVFIYRDTLANMESDPKFNLFIEAIFQDAMDHPDQLKNLEEVWGSEWDELLKGVDGREATEVSA